MAFFFGAVTHKRNFTTVLLLLTLIASSVLLVRFVPSVAVDNMLAKDIKLEAAMWEARVINRMSDGEAVFKTQNVSEEDTSFLSDITKGSDVYRFSLFTPDGHIFWSSHEADIGQYISESFFSEIISTGQYYYLHEAAHASEVDDFILHAATPNDRGLREIAKVFAPIVRNGETLGAIEFFTDITDLRDIFIFRVRYALSVICGVVLILISVIIFVVLRSGYISTTRRNLQQNKERDLLEQQLHLAREVRLLGELNEWLQSSRSLDELFDMVGEFMTHILPSCEGSVYVYSNSRDVLDGCASWNGGHHKEHIHPDACWGLRRGRTYSYGQSEVNFVCEHIDDEDGRPYFCFPILAHGETVGLLTLRAAVSATQEDFEAGKKLSQMCAEQISMAIANVQMRDQLHDQSVKDPLTGLFNRRHLTDSLRKLITRSSKNETELSLISIDVDHFKKFNDNYGHDAGDMVLRAVGTSMAQHCDGDEVACRHGGEEFMLLLPGLSKEDTFERAEKLRKNIEEITVRYGDKNLPRITISIGISYFPDHGRIPQDLMRAADEALYEAKAQGRNQTIVAQTNNPKEQLLAAQ